MMSNRKMLLCLFGIFLVALVLPTVSFLCFIKNTDFFLSRQVSLTDLTSLLGLAISFLTLAATIVLAVYVVRKMGKEDAERRTEKDLMIGHLKDFKAALDLTVSRIQDGYDVDFVYVTSELKKLRTVMQFITETSIRYKLCRQEDVNTYTVDTRIRDLNELLTEEDSGTGFTVVGGKISINNLGRSHINRHVKSINESVFDLSVLINRA